MVVLVDLDELVEYWTLLEDERELVAGKQGPTRRSPTRQARFPTATPTTSSIRSPPGLNPADDEKMIAATRAFAAAMRPFSTGASYLNFTHEANRVRDAYSDAKVRPPGGPQGHLRPG